MSSLAASRADNFYFPPEWRPEMGGISKFQGSKGANQYEQYGIIRFELPFDGWCLGCGRHMSKGLRFNAKKDKAGKYLSTQIWSFSMKCYSCEQRFKVLTDPQNSTYNFSEGLRKHEQEFEPEVGDSIIVAVSDEARRQISSDPMFKLQHLNEDIKKIETEKQRFESLSEIKESLYKDDYNMNSLLRKANRTRKRKEKDMLEEGAKRGLAIPLLEPHEADSTAANLVTFKKSKSESFKVVEREKLTSIQSESFFQNSHSTVQSGVDTKRRQTEAAIMKQSRIKLNPSHFKMQSFPNKESSIPVVTTTLTIRKRPPNQAKNSEESIQKGALDALSMLADY